MSIAIRCPKCSREYTVPDAVAGRRTTCRACSTPFFVPVPELVLDLSIENVVPVRSIRKYHIASAILIAILEVASLFYIWLQHPEIPVGVVQTVLSFLIGALVYLWLFALMDCLAHEEGERHGKLIWCAVIITLNPCLFPLGAVLYLFIRIPERS